MCTVSIIPWPGGEPGYRLVCNRDESRARPPAEGPRWRELKGGAGGLRAVWPTDPLGGGTWLAAGEQGLGLCLLNYNLEPEHLPASALPAGGRSRGAIIPELIGLGSLAEVGPALAERDLGVYAPFRLLGVEPAAPYRVMEARWDRRSLEVVPPRSEGPVCLVSSGLGDSLVRPRLGLFREMVRTPDGAEQDRFHRHAWPERPEISVLMRRAAARTVSVATLEVRRGGSGWEVEMAYEPVEEGPE